MAPTTPTVTTVISGAAVSTGAVSWAGLLTSGSGVVTVSPPQAVRARVRAADRARAMMFFFFILDSS